VSFLRIKEFNYAVEDATSALLLTSNARAHICRAFGYFFMQQYTKAFEDYESASKLEPNNSGLQKALQAAKEGLSIQLKRIKDVATASLTGKKVRDTALEWIGDFGLLAIDEEALPTDALLMSKQGPATTVLNNFLPPHTAANIGAQDEMPSLIPIGDWANELENTLDTPEKMCKSAIDEKLAGNAAFKAQQYTKAVGHYSKAMWLHCTDGVYYSNRGMAYIKLGRWAEAITDCSISLEYGPSVKAFLRRGTAWAAMGYYWLAIQDYKGALEYEPANRDCIKGIECALNILDGQTQAALVLSPNNEQLLCVHAKIKDEFQALAVLRVAADQVKAENSKSKHPSEGQPEAPTQKPNIPKTHHSDFAKLQEMLSRFTTMIAADKLNTGARIGRADIYIQLGDIDNARADYRLGLKFDPDNPELLKRWHAVKKKKSNN
jgi:tetratricopeptide (TPR) repeat protein